MKFPINEIRSLYNQLKIFVKNFLYPDILLNKSVVFKKDQDELHDYGDKRKRSAMVEIDSVSSLYREMVFRVFLIFHPSPSCIN